MKNKVKFFCAIATVVAIGFSVTACDFLDNVFQPPQVSITIQGVHGRNGQFAEITLYDAIGVLIANTASRAVIGGSSVTVGMLDADTGELFIRSNAASVRFRIFGSSTGEAVIRDTDPMPIGRPITIGNNIIPLSEIALPAFLEIQGIPLSLEQLYADVQLFSGNWDSPTNITSISREQILDTSTPGDQLTHLSVQVDVPNTHRLQTHNISFRGYDDAVTEFVRVAGIRTSTFINEGVNIVPWTAITRTGAISLRITDIYEYIEADRTIMGEQRVYLDGATAVITVFRKDDFLDVDIGNQPPPVALSGVFSIERNSTLVELYDNYPADRVAPYDFDDIMIGIAPGMPWFDGVEPVIINLEERFYTRGYYEIFMMVVANDVPPVILEWSGFIGFAEAKFLDFYENSVQFSEFVDIRWAGGDMGMQSLGRNATGQDLARIFRESVIRARQSRGLR